MGDVHQIRPFQSATKHKGNRALYTALVRSIAADQKAGNSGHRPLFDVRATGKPPKDCA